MKPGNSNARNCKILWNHYQTVFWRPSTATLSPKNCKRHLVGYARRRTCSCSRLPQMSGNAADPAKGRSRRVRLFWVLVAVILESGGFVEICHNYLIWRYIIQNSKTENAIFRFHAVYGEYIALFDINTLKVIEGDLPQRARKLVVEWAENYQSELKTIWETQEFKKLPPLEWFWKWLCQK